MTDWICLLTQRAGWGCSRCALQLHEMSTGHGGPTAYRPRHIWLRRTCQKVLCSLLLECLCSSFFQEFLPDSKIAVDSICNVFITDVKGGKQMESWVPDSGYCRGCGGGGRLLATTEGGRLMDCSLVLASPSVRIQLESVNVTGTGVLHQHNSCVSGYNYSCLQFWVNAVLTTPWRLYHCSTTCQLKKLNSQWKTILWWTLYSVLLQCIVRSNMTNHHLSKMPLLFIRFSSPRPLPGAHWHRRATSAAHAAQWPTGTCVREVRATLWVPCNSGQFWGYTQRKPPCPLRDDSVAIPWQSTCYSFLWLMKGLQLLRYFDKSATLCAVHLSLELPFTL